MHFSNLPSTFSKNVFHYFSYKYTSLPTKHIKHFGLRTKYIGPFTHGTQQTNDFIMNFPFPKRPDHRFQTNSFWDTSSSEKYVTVQYIQSSLSGLSGEISACHRCRLEKIEVSVLRWKTNNAIVEMDGAKVPQF